MMTSILDFVCSVVCTAIAVLLGIVLIIGTIVLIFTFVGGTIAYLCTGEIFKALLCLLGTCLIPAIWIVVLNKI